MLGGPAPGRRPKGSGVTATVPFSLQFAFQFGVTAGGVETRQDQLQWGRLLELLHLCPHAAARCPSQRCLPALRQAQQLSLPLTGPSGAATCSLLGARHQAAPDADGLAPCGPALSSCFSNRPSGLSARSPMALPAGFGLWLGGRLCQLTGKCGQCIRACRKDRAMERSVTLLCWWGKGSGDTGKT